MNAKEAAFALALVVALMAVISGAAQAQMFTSTAARELKNLGELKQGLEQATIENAKKAKLKAMGEKVGRGFWSDCFAEKVLDKELISKVVSLGSACGDHESDGSWIDLAHGALRQSECSYTSPKANMLNAVMNLKGSKKAVLFTFDSRNWNNYGPKGVIVAMSEGDVAFMSAEKADEWKIAAEDWKDPGSKIIGVAKPFSYTFQEADCASFSNIEVPPQDVDYATVFKTKGRVIEQSFWLDGKELPGVTRLTIKEVSDSKATVLRESLDAQGKARSPATEEQLDFSDKSLGRPTARRVAGSEKEIESAYRKWKVEKWTSTVDGGELIWWMSTEIPGLIVHFAAPSEKIEMWLVGFKDPEEK